MYQSFWVDSKNVETVKGLVRQHPSLRFVANPLTVGNSAQFCLEGEVEDFNALNTRLEKVEESDATIPLQKKGLFGFLGGILRFPRS